MYKVPDDTWMLGIGIRAANRVLDDLERILLEAYVGPSPQLPRPRGAKVRINATTSTAPLTRSCA